MANDCSNRLLIYCDNEQILEKIHDLFYQDKDGEILYTMMKLVPVPADKYDDEGNALIGFFTPMGYWGTRSDFWSPKPIRRKNEFVLEYNTANGPNKYWIETLISSIMVALDEFSEATKPKLFIKHLFDILQLQTAGFLYWEPGMTMEYDYSTEEKPNEKVISEFKSIEYEHEREMEVFEFCIEDYLDEEPMKDEIILPSELIDEMKNEFHPMITQPDNPINQYYQSRLAYLELLERIFSPNELLALFRHSYIFYHTKDWENLIPKVITALDSADLKSYDIENLEEFVDKINSIPGFLHFGVIDVLCNSERIERCHDFKIKGDVENDRYNTDVEDIMQEQHNIDVEDIMQEPYNIDLEDITHEPYNPELDKFNIQLEKLANPNLE